MTKKEKQTLAEAQQTLAATIDEFALLHEQLAPMLDRYEQLKKVLSAEVKKDDTDESVTLTGTSFAIDYTKPSSQANCTVDAREFIKLTKSWDAVKVSVEAARKLVPAALFSQLFTQSLGSRRLKRVRVLIK